MMIKTRALDFNDTKGLLSDLLGSKSKLIDEYGIFEIDSYWVTHFIYEFQYNSDSKWVHQIDVDDDLADYIILKYCF